MEDEGQRTEDRRQRTEVRGWIRLRARPRRDKAGLPSRSLGVGWRSGAKGLVLRHECEACPVVRPASRTLGTDLISAKSATSQTAWGIAPGFHPMMDKR